MQLKPETKILGIGSPILDILVNVDDAFIASAGGGKGGMALVDTAAQDKLVAEASKACKQKLAIGGSSANTIFGLAQLGAKTAFLGCLGEDTDAEFYKKSYASIGGDLSRFKTSGKAHTGRCLSMITPDSERTMRTDLGAACLLSKDNISVADFKGFSLVHAEGYLLYMPGLLEHILKEAKQAGCEISLDLSTFDVVKRNIATLPSLLKDYVDVVFANEDEAREFCVAQGMTFSPELAVETLGKLCPTAAVKLGKDGAIIRRNGANSRVKAELVKAIDTTGAGDLWQAGFLYGYINGKSPEACAKMGAVLGAEVVQVLGAEIPAARWSEIKKKISKIG